MVNPGITVTQLKRKILSSSRKTFAEESYSSPENHQIVTSSRHCNIEHVHCSFEATQWQVIVSIDSPEKLSIFSCFTLFPG